MTRTQKLSDWRCAGSNCGRSLVFSSPEPSFRHVVEVSFSFLNSTTNAHGDVTDVILSAMIAQHWREDHACYQCLHPIYLLMSRLRSCSMHLRFDNQLPLATGECASIRAVATSSVKPTQGHPIPMQTHVARIALAFFLTEIPAEP